MQLIQIREKETIKFCSFKDQLSFFPQNKDGKVGSNLYFFLL